MPQLQLQTVHYTTTNSKGCPTLHVNDGTALVLSLYAVILQLTLLAIGSDVTKLVKIRIRQKRTLTSKFVKCECE